ncbi:hypothetical protein IV102_25735, partial [bacterium]|nr:hypothetical protein [bacterium]
LQWHSDLDLELACHRAEKCLDHYPEAEARLRALQHRYPDQQGLLTGYLAQTKMEAGYFDQARELYLRAFRELPLARTWIGPIRRSLGLLSARWSPPVSPAEAQFCEEALTSVMQLKYHAHLPISPSQLVYLLSGARARGLDLRPWLGGLVSIVYHTCPLPLHHWLQRWLLSSMHGASPKVRALTEGPITVSGLGAPSHPATVNKLEEIYQQLQLERSQFHPTMAYFVLGILRMMAGEMEKMARDCVGRLQDVNPLLRLLALHQYLLSHGDLPSSPGPDLLPAAASGDVFFATQRAAVAALIALRTGDFDPALCIFRGLNRGTLSLDECILAAWHATLARSAAEALPRRAGKQRERLLAEAEAQVRRCLRRSQRFLFYHLQALRERGLLLLLRGREEEGRAAMRVALAEARRCRMPYQEVLTLRELVRCGRELGWPEAGLDEQACVRLCSQIKTPWLLPARSPLWPDLRKLAAEAERVLSGHTDSAPPTGELLSHSPQWRGFWTSLSAQAARRARQLQQWSESLRLLNYSTRWLDELGRHPLLRWGESGVQVEAPSPRRTLVRTLQAREGDEIRRRLRGLRPLSPAVESAQHRIEARLSPGLPGLLAEFQVLDCHGSPPTLTAYEDAVLASALRELLTNATRHGSQVSLLWKDGELWLANSIETTASKGTGRGLEYVRLRLAEIGVGFDFHVGPESARARLTFPAAPGGCGP